MKFFLLVILTDTGKAVADYCLVACFMPSRNLAWSWRARWLLGFSFRAFS